MKTKIFFQKMIMLLFVICSFHMVSYGQSSRITGVVTDMAGEPLIGVNVQIKRTNIGTITDFDGNFTIVGVMPGDTLVFSYIGMKKVEVGVRGLSVIHVVMRDDFMVLSTDTFQKGLLTFYKDCVFFDYDRFLRTRIQPQVC
ncbi:carboxypeptidase-like regulatory domain-containing protein [Gabonibacter massiliensis]|uniref:carboxypeptidase-like regulatory domain-containing protein n=1 Tax=Gabonibacter massiliensis TaxID=1720195 RepID=UPI00073EE1A6|nr:carboxypeptidase-like regulatory domain-containing protein [Gabonibacter massiliensis]